MSARSIPLDSVEADMVDDNGRPIWTDVGTQVWALPFVTRDMGETYRNIVLMSYDPGSGTELLVTELDPRSARLLAAALLKAAEQAETHKPSQCKIANRVLACANAGD